MNRILLSLVLFSIVLFSFKSTDTVNIFMIGDSTMANKSEKAAPETGWGMVLNSFFTDDVKVHNHAQNGRSSKSFIGEGRWKVVLDSLKAGDYVVIQFGHNDAKPDSARHTDPATTYKENIRKFVMEARSKGAFPIICSSVVRKHFDGAGNLIDTHGDYIKASREVAAEMNVPFVDMEAKTRKLVSSMGSEKSKSIYLFAKPGEYPNRPKGVADSTHLNRQGATEFAKLFVEGLTELNHPLVAKLKK